MNKHDDKGLISSRHFLTAQPKALYSSQQVYAIEQAWFKAGYDSFALMQQAAWQMAQVLIKHAQRYLASSHLSYAGHRSTSIRAIVWAGLGNNGGDGWLVAHYLQQSGWQVTVIDVGEIDPNSDSDASRARRIAMNAECDVKQFKELLTEVESDSQRRPLPAHYHIDALFGIGLDRAPTGKYKQAIEQFNSWVKEDNAFAVAVDIPSGLVASTGQVFSGIAIRADLTLCLVAAKLGLYIKDGIDYIGRVIDLPLIPFSASTDHSAWRLTKALPMTPRRQNSHKGSYGHVLIIGGNQSLSAQGMGGAAILSTGSALISGAGKVTTACHSAFHGALLATNPNAMTVDLEDRSSVDALIQSADVIAIGMGFGRNDKAFELFKHYLSSAIQQKKAMVIDADGLYHLASLKLAKDSIIDTLKQHSQDHQVCFTPHSGEAARLLDSDSERIEADRLAAIQQCSKEFGGDWLLKGAGSLVQVDGDCYVCSVGNSGMATAGMGDVLSGLIAGLMAQRDLPDWQRSLYQAVLIHGMAGDLSIGRRLEITKSSGFHTYRDNQSMSLGEMSGLNREEHGDRLAPRHAIVGKRGLQAQDIIAAIGVVMEAITQR